MVKGQGVQNLEIRHFPENTPDGHKAKHSQRGFWVKQLDYIMAILGCIVGYGNVWRFPYLCFKNGGGAFLIPYIFFFLTCGIPVFFLEVTVGQFSGKSGVHIWEVCPILKGVGIGQFIATICSLIPYQHILVWVIYYIGMSCAAVLPWTNCNNEWNTDHCRDVTRAGLNSTYTKHGRTILHNYNNTVGFVDNNTMVPEFTFSHTDVEEFWKYKTLKMSEGVHHIGRVQWHLAVSLIASWVLIFLCVIKGVRSVGKVIYVTALLPYVLLIVLLVRTSLLPGALDGMLVFLKPNFEKLRNVQVWLEALIQVFYSLSVGWGTIINLSSYNRFNDNVLSQGITAQGFVRSLQRSPEMVDMQRLSPNIMLLINKMCDATPHYDLYIEFKNSIVITCIGEGTSLLCGMVIYTVLGSMAEALGVAVSEVAASGPGLVFVAYPEGLSRLPVPQLWALLFFIMMMLVGLDSQFLWTEGIITVIVDQFPHKLQRRRVFVTAIVCTICCALGIVFTTEAGVYYMQLVDWYIGAVCVVLYGILECVTFTWIYGTEQLSKDVELMLGRKTPVLLNLLLQYATPAFLSVALVLILWGFEPPNYGDYEYPTSCLVVGWILACLPLLFVPFMGAVVLYKTKGTLLQRVKMASTAEESWVPALVNYRKVRNEPSEFSHSLT